MKLERVLPLFVVGVIFLALLACGIKGPPILPERSMPFKVKHLTGEWNDGVVYLKGHVVPRYDDHGNAPDALGCTIYHARHDLGNPPCEGCPVKYGILEEIKADVIKGDKFHCQFPRKKTKGIHFFKVRLLEPKGALGPSSNGAKLLMIDYCLLKSRKVTSQKARLYSLNWRPAWPNIFPSFLKNYIKSF